MIVQGSISENEDLSKDRYAANSRIERTAVVEELKQQGRQSQLLGQGTDSADFLLSTNLIESGKHIDSEPYNDASEKIVCSVIRNDIITGSQDDDALAESVIAIQAQNTDGVTHQIRQTFFTAARCSGATRTSSPCSAQSGIGGKPGQN